MYKIDPIGFHVCYNCDTPACCNPYHLFLGVDRDNHNDKILKNRHCKGSEHPFAKLTERDVKRIRASTKLQSKIAKEYGVDKSLISRIRSYQFWKHVS